MAFTIAYNSIAEEMGLTATEQGIVFSSIFYGVTVAQVKKSIPCRSISVGVCCSDVVSLFETCQACCRRIGQKIRGWSDGNSNDTQHEPLGTWSRLLLQM